MICRPDIPPLRLPLLITGIAGVPGYNALRWFQSQYPGQVVGIRQRDNLRLNGSGIVPCDAEDPAGLARLFDEHRFQSVLNCAGNCALRACELDKALAWRTNVEGVRNLLTVLDSRDDVRLVHLSVDLVFSGDRNSNTRQGDYVESDPTDPVTEYGATMAAAERLILAAAPWACILRISLPMGISFNGHAGAIDWIQSRFRKSRPATLYFDEVRTPTYTDCLNELCDVILRNEAAGLLHAGAPRPLSLYQIAQVINRVGGYDPLLLRGCPRIEAGPIPPRAGNVAMCSQKLIDTIGYQPFDPWPLDEKYVPTDREWHHRAGAAGRGSPALLAKVLCRNPRR